MSAEEGFSRADRAFISFAFEYESGPASLHRRSFEVDGEEIDGFTAYSFPSIAEEYLPGAELVEVRYAIRDPGNDPAIDTPGRPEEGRESIHPLGFLDIELRQGADAVEGSISHALSVTERDVQDYVHAFVEAIEQVLGADEWVEARVEGADLAEFSYQPPRVGEEPMESGVRSDAAAIRETAVEAVEAVADTYAGLLEAEKGECIGALSPYMYDARQVDGAQLEEMFGILEDARELQQEAETIRSKLP